MKPLYCFNRFGWPDESATSQLLQDVAEAAAKSGREVHVVCSRSGAVEEPAHPSVNFHRLPAVGHGGTNLVFKAINFLLYYLGAWWFVRTQLPQGALALVKTDPPLLAAILRRGLQSKQACQINWWQDIYPEVAIGLRALPWPLNGCLGWLRPARDRALVAAAANVALGERMQHWLQGRGQGKSKAVVEIIPNWSTDLTWLPQPQADNLIRQQCQADDGPVFAYSGNLGRAHLVEPLLELSRLADQRQGFRCLMIGGGAGLARLQSASKDADDWGWSCLPAQPREMLSESLGAADVHLVTLNPAMEGLIVPSKLYGIMAAARPVLFIGDLEGEVASLLDRHDCGISVAPNDNDALQAAVAKLIDQPDWRQQLGRNARMAFEANYHPQLSIGKWLALFARLDAD